MFLDHANGYLLSFMRMRVGGRRRTTLRTALSSPDHARASADSHTGVAGVRVAET
jgi:hypothetical protein